MRYLCCSDCFEKIARKNTRAASLWLDMCAVFIRERGPFSIRNFDSAELRYLETKRYITTTEDGPYVAVKVHGYHLDKENDEIFCLNLREHQKGSLHE